MSTDEKRFNELYNRAYSKGFTAYTEFLNMQEQSDLAKTCLPCKTYGGYEGAERVVAAFGDRAEKENFPIVCVKIFPVSSKFADALTHRDYLGALMNLGIRRELLGDIVIQDNCGWLFCLEHISQYIADNLSRVKHTTVTTQITAELPASLCVQAQSREIIAASLRLDALVGAVYRLSRKEAAQLILHGKVFINSRQAESCSKAVKPNDTVTVRGKGRFQLIQQLRSTKSDRLVLEIKM